MGEAPPALRDKPPGLPDSRTSGPILYIAGDVHLRDGTGPFPAFLDQLAALPPARLVILGDLFDYWLETDAACARYAPVLARLRALRAQGWQLDLVRGNRELAAGRRLAAASGCTLHWPRLDLMLGPVRLRIVHGDRLCHDPKYHGFAAWIRSYWHRAWQTLHPAWFQDAVAQWMRSHSKAEQRARAQQPTRNRVFIDPRRVVASGRGSDVVVAGHIHEAWRRRVRGTDLMLVGDWPGRQGRWIEGHADGRLVACVDQF